tara:strand:+ start:498 stop:1976 length:1479 start_codon:yes stop_codon:yes gene_type:complete
MARSKMKKINCNKNIIKQSIKANIENLIASDCEEMIKLGEKDIRISKREMPGLTELSKEYKKQQPLKGARITGCLHMTVQTAILIETLVDLGADIRWSSCNIFSTQDHAASYIASKNIPVFAWKGETLEEYWWCVFQSLNWQGKGPDLIVDDGGDVTLLIHQGVEFEKNGKLENETSLDQKTINDLLKKVHNEYGNKYWHQISKSIKGVSEETTTGVLRLNQMHNSGTLLFPAINVNDSVTKSKFDNIYGCRHSLVDSLNRATDNLISGKKALVCGYGDVGKGSCESLLGQNAIVAVAEIDPICALQACMKGLRVMTVEEAVKENFDIFVTATGNKDIINVEHMRKMKTNSIVCNIGHFDNEIDMAGLEKMLEEKKAKKEEIKENVHLWSFEEEKSSIIILAEGRLVNLSCATGHPSLVMSCSFANQVLAQIDLFNNKHKIEVTTLSKKLDEKVARLHMKHFNANLTELTEIQGEYIQVPIEGPYKSEEYRY